MRLFWSTRAAMNVIMNRFKGISTDFNFNVTANCREMVGEHFAVTQEIHERRFPYS